MEPPAGVDGGEYGERADRIYGGRSEHSLPTTDRMMTRRRYR